MQCPPTAYALGQRMLRLRYSGLSDRVNASCVFPMAEIWFPARAVLSRDSLRVGFAAVVSGFRQTAGGRAKASDFLWLYGTVETVP
jgi:hypothetical protein